MCFFDVFESVNLKNGRKKMSNDMHFHAVDLDEGKLKTTWLIVVLQTACNSTSFFFDDFMSYENIGVLVIPIFNGAIGNFHQSHASRDILGPFDWSKTA